MKIPPSWIPPKKHGATAVPASTVRDGDSALQTRPEASPKRQVNPAGSAYTPPPASQSAPPAGSGELPELPMPARTIYGDNRTVAGHYFTADQMRAIRDAGIEYGRRLATAGQGVEWQPIETAPKESVVVLFCDRNGNRWTQTADCRVPVCGQPPAFWRHLPAATSPEQRG